MFEANGPCAKVRVFCTILATNGSVFRGENWCENPQQQCPRRPGEDYTKCNTICRTLGHAEAVALEMAGKDAKDAVAVVEKHKDDVCEPCREALNEAGIRETVVVSQRPVNNCPKTSGEKS